MGADRPTDVPADATLPERHPDAPQPGEEIPSHYRYCYGCGVDHATGLHMQLRAGEGLTVTGEFEIDDNHQGAPGLAHGGVLSAAFDESLGALNWLLRRPAVTGRLETNFLRPVPVGSLLHIDAQVVGQSRRKVYTSAIGRLGGPYGPVALTASALFIQVPVEHFTTHGRADEVRKAAADRQSAAPGAELEMNP